MQFNIKNRNGPGRIAEVAINNKKIVTPNILYINTKRFKAPEFADILISNESVKTDKPSLIFTGKLVLKRKIEDSCIRGLSYC